jgi:tetratricopeptide (TPR) repeat protein
MKALNITAKYSSSIIAIIALFTVGLTTASAESWELRTAAEEVNGTRDLEAGNLDKSIRVLERSYRSTPYDSKGAVLTNLCVAHTLKRDFETAMDYCNRAAERGNGSREAFNNRGVLNALLGNYTGAVSDFKKAGCLNECPSDLANQGNDRMDVAQRNLDRAQTELANQSQPVQGVELTGNVQ